MDTIIALGIIVVAGIFVFRRVFTQMKNKKAGGCGCSGECGPECSSGDAGGCGCGQKKQCTNDKREA